MRFAGLLAMVGALAGTARPGSAQIMAAPRWFATSRGMLGRPPASADATEILRLERYLYFGDPYCGGLAASAYAANFQVERQLTSYLASVQTSAPKPQIEMTS